MTQDFEVEEDNIFDLVLKSRADQFKKNTVPQTYVSNNNREEIPWYGLENGQESVIRIIGDPPSPKRKNNWNGKFIFYSELLTDSKKRYSDILWHTEMNPHGQSEGFIDTDWILHRLFDTVYKKSWDNRPFIDEKGYPRKGKYLFENEHTSVYKLLESNELELNNNVKIYPKKAKPSKRVILPVLVRNEGSTQIKILTTKHTVKEYTDSQGVVKQQVYCDFGIPVSETDNKKYLYDLILDEIVLKFKHWYLDIVIKKTKLTDIQIAYSIHPSYSDSVSSLAKSYVTSFPQMKEVTVMVNNKPILEKIPEKVLLTQEEIDLPKPDIDKLFEETTYKKLYTYHKELFKLTDSELGTSFYPELVELFRKESPENASKIPAEKVTLPVKENIVSGNTPVTSVPEPNAVRTRLPVTDVIQETIEQQCSRVFTNWENLTDSEKKLMVTTIDTFVDDVPKFKSQFSKDMCACNCDKQFLRKDGTPSGKQVSCHLDIKNCPMCSEKFA